MNASSRKNDAARPASTELPDYHQAFADIYDDIRGEICATETDADIAVRSLSAPPGAKLLDWGCGTGAHAKALSRRGYAVTGVDVSPAMIERARADATAKGAVFFCGEITDFAQRQRAAAFDGFYSYANVLNCLRDRAAMAQALRAIAGLLRKDARGLVDVWNIAPLLAQGTRDTVREFSSAGRRYLQAMRAVLEPAEQTLQVEYSVFTAEPQGDLWRRVSSLHRLHLLTLAQYSELFAEAGFAVERIQLQRPREESRPATESDRLVSLLVRRG